MTPRPEIRAMTRADLDATCDVIEAGGFGDRRQGFELALALPNCTPLVATLDGRPVGSGVATVNGEAGWVGTIFVAPELRGQGLGRELTVAVCDILEAAGCRSLLLIATDLGRPVYERLGFRVQSWYHMFNSTPLVDPPQARPGTTLRPIAEGDLDAIAALDRLASGEDRRCLVEAHAARGRLLEDATPSGRGRLRGFVMPGGRGHAAVIAEDPEDALCLLEMHRHLVDPTLVPRAGLLTEHEAGRRTLASRGWEVGRAFPRMLRGDEPDWRPELIWGQYNHAMD